MQYLMSISENEELMRCRVPVGAPRGVVDRGRGTRTCFDENFETGAPVAHRYIKRVVISAVLLISIGLSGCGMLGADLVRNWHANRSSGQAALAKGDYAGAKASFEKAMTVVQSSPNNTMRMIISLKDLSGLCSHSEDFKGTPALTDKALSLAEKMRNADISGQGYYAQYELGEALENFGNYYYNDVKDFQKAALIFQNAVSIFERLIAGAPAATPNCFPGYHLAQCLSGLGQSYVNLQQIDEAERVFDQGTKPEFVKSYPEVGKSRLLASYNDLPLSKSKKLAFAARLGSGSSDSAGTGLSSAFSEHLSKGRQLMREGKFEEAEREMVAAQGAAILVPPPDLQLAEMLENLGLCYIKLDKTEAAKKPLLKALEILEKVNTQNPQQLCGCLYALAALYLQSNQANKAEPYAIRRRALWLAAVGCTDPEALRSTIFLGDVYFAEKKLDEAQRCFVDVVNLLNKSPQLKPALLVRAYNGEAQVYVAQNNYRKALTILEQALKLSRTSTDSDPQATALSESLYSDVSKHLGLKSNSQLQNTGASGTSAHSANSHGSHP